MIQVQNISLAFGGQKVLDELSWTVKPNRRIGLIGPNGAGKSTLLKILADLQGVDAGTVTMGGSDTVGYLAQDAQEGGSEQTVINEALSAFEHVLALQSREKALTAEIAEADDHQSESYRRLLDELDRVHVDLNAAEAHLVRPKTEAVLLGLGFEPDELDRPMSTFSGGWKMRVALAKILLREPEYLLLDEPTNHLDIVSIDWLESYLRSYRGTVVIVSHDRYFLDRMVNTIAELSRGKITEYAGNYSYYLEERVHRRELQRAAYENQQKQIADTERFIERFRYKNTKARQVQSRVKMLEKLERIQPPESEEAEIRIRFPEPRRSGKVVLEISRFSKAYESEEGTVEVFQDAGPLTIQRGDKIALIGKNGAGKSTLARILNGTEEFSGTRTEGHNVGTTFFAQHQADTLQPDLTVLESLQEVAHGQNETELRTILGAFLFTGDDVYKETRVLSGGEKSRVAFARTLLHPANFLILDEPTNHLDIKSINVLIEALVQYGGSFVVVSHDRHFLDQVANRVWYVGEGNVRTYDGTYSEYQWFLEHGTRPDRNREAPPQARAEVTAASDVKASKTGSGGPKSKEQKRREAEERNRRHQELREGKLEEYETLTPRQVRALYEKAEEEILQLEEQKAKLEKQLADPDVYEDGEQVRVVTAQYSMVKDRLEERYREWELLAEQVEA